MEVTRLLKGDPHSKDIPIIMLTAKGEEADIVAGLDLGAEDYISKPFSPRILVARVRAAFRRKRKSPQDEASALKIPMIWPSIPDAARYSLMARQCL